MKKVEQALIRMIEELEVDLDDALFRLSETKEEVSVLKKEIEEQNKRIEVLNMEIRYLKFNPLGYDETR